MAINQDKVELTLQETRELRKELQNIANKIGKIIRVDQLILIGMLLLSKKYVNLAQLATNFGKSFIMGIMAFFLNQEHKEKVVVVTPTDTLAAV